MNPKTRIRWVEWEAACNLSLHPKTGALEGKLASQTHKNSEPWVQQETLSYIRERVIKGDTECQTLGFTCMYKCT